MIKSTLEVLVNGYPVFSLFLVSSLKLFIVLVSGLCVLLSVPFVLRYLRKLGIIGTKNKNRPSP